MAVTARGMAGSNSSTALALRCHVPCVGTQQIPLHQHRGWPIGRMVYSTPSFEQEDFTGVLLSPYYMLAHAFFLFGLIFRTTLQSRFYNFYFPDEETEGLRGPGSRPFFHPTSFSRQLP